MIVLVKKIGGFYKMAGYPYHISEILPDDYPIEVCTNNNVFELNISATVGQYLNLHRTVAKTDNEIFAETSDVHKLGYIRMRRDNMLTMLDPVVQRHTEEVALGNGTTLSTEEYISVLDYKQALRDFPNNVDLSVFSMECIEWPIPPSCITTGGM